MAVSCLWRQRHPLTRRFCRARGIYINGHYLCPHHIGVARARGGGAMEFRPQGAPALYAQDGRGLDAIVYAHYFLGSSDWLVTEYDPDEDVAFGWACISGDRQNAELGYVSITELEGLRIPTTVHMGGLDLGSFEQKVERDAHWPEGLTLTEAIARLDERDGRTS